MVASSRGKRNTLPRSPGCSLCTIGQRVKELRREVLSLLPELEQELGDWVFGRDSREAVDKVYEASRAIHRLEVALFNHTG